MKCFYNVTQVTDIFLNIAICKRRSEVAWLLDVTWPKGHVTPNLEGWDARMRNLKLRNIRSEVPLRCSLGRPLLSFS